MKTRVFIVVFFLMIMQLPCHAQALGAAKLLSKSKIIPKLYTGIKFGGNFSYLSGNNWDNGIKSNLVGGAFAGLKGLGFGVQFETLFEQSDYTTGSDFYTLYHNYYNDISDSIKGGTFRVNKLCMPILLQFRMARLLWLQTGIQFYGVVSVRDYNSLVKDAKELFKTGNTAAVLGATIRIGNADIGARAIVDFQSLNNLNANDVWRQYMIQAHFGIKLF
ncbi:MAG: hypothetical protein QM530_04740 [Phycisphaerales bacterium]|nr:hypothetical protein [Phycisphaerales bacterium]